MHEGQLGLDDALAARLIAAQLPELGGRPLTRVRTTGTVNAIFRLGDDLVARFPLLPASSDEIEAEAASLDEFATVSPFAAPRPVAVGLPSESFPSAWAVQTWIDGDIAAHDRHAASVDLARDLVRLIVALRAADPRGRTFDGRGRGGSLPDHDEWMAHCIAHSADLLDAPLAKRLWGALRELPATGPDVMSHRDLTPFNLLVHGDRLAGVLDAGGFGPADPALDLVVAWHLFDAPARQVMREELGTSEVEWRRGAAWAFQQAMGLGWYYRDTNPEMSALGLSTMRRLLDDEELARLL